jgi:hypothetical protein
MITRKKTPETAVKVNVNSPDLFKLANSLEFTGEKAVSECRIYKLQFIRHFSFLLQSDWIDKAISDGSLSKQYLQFLVYSLQRSYTITDNDISEENIEERLLIDIYKSKYRSTKLCARVKLPEFFKILFANAFERSRLHQLLPLGVDLLTNFIAFQKIPAHDRFNGACCYLLICQLASIAQYFEVDLGACDLDTTLDVKEAAFVCIERIIDVFHAACDSVLYGPKIAEELCKAMLEEPEVFILQLDQLTTLFHLLKYDVSYS